MNYFIAVEHTQYEGEYVYTYRTDATLSLVKRWCNAKDYDLIAYGDMQVFNFDEHDTLSAELMKEDIQTWLNEIRENKKRWALKLETIDPVDIRFEYYGLHRLITNSPWMNFERIPSSAPLYDYKNVFKYGKEANANEAAP